MRGYEKPLTSMQSDHYLLCAATAAELRTAVLTAMILKATA